MVRLGEWDAGHSQQEPHPHQEVPAQRIIIHPEFFPGALFFDIALIILAYGADVSRWAAFVHTTRRTLKPILISRDAPFKEVILQHMCHQFYRNGISTAKVQKVCNIFVSLSSRPRETDSLNKTFSQKSCITAIVHLIIIIVIKSLCSFLVTVLAIC